MISCIDNARGARLAGRPWGTAGDGHNTAPFAGVLGCQAGEFSPDEGGIAVAGDGPIRQWEVIVLWVSAHEHIHKAVRARGLKHVQLENGFARRGRHLQRQEIHCMTTRCQPSSATRLATQLHAHGAIAENHICSSERHSRLGVSA